MTELANRLEIEDLKESLREVQKLLHRHKLVESLIEVSDAVLETLIARRIPHFLDLLLLPFSATPPRGSCLPGQIAANQSEPALPGIESTLRTTDPSEAPMSATSKLQTTDMSSTEWQARCDLAAPYRIIDHFGWTDVLNTHMSARIPGEKGSNYRT